MFGFLENVASCVQNWMAMKTVHINKFYFPIFSDCLVGLAAASATAEQEVLGSIPRSDMVLLGCSIRDF